jgi:hypothetical protein
MLSVIQFKEMGIVNYNHIFLYLCLKVRYANNDVLLCFLRLFESFCWGFFMRVEIRLRLTLQMIVNGLYLRIAVTVFLLFTII